MHLNEIEAKSFIMALFIRDDGLRFLLGSGAYEFKETQLMFAGNTIENDVVSIQGNDGYMLAGQVRRPSTQVFDGYIGDASVPKSEIEGYRRDFFAFFQKNHFYTVVYILADGSSIQRRRGFLVDAPTVQELWQLFPEYHVGMNFEDVNYYRYSENDEGEETYGKSADIGLAKVQYGGLIWDDNTPTTITGEGTEFSINGTVDSGELDSVSLKGDTQQQTYSGKNLAHPVPLGYADMGITASYNSITGEITLSGTATGGYSIPFSRVDQTIPAGTYTIKQYGELTHGRMGINFRRSDGTQITEYVVNTGTLVNTFTLSEPAAKTYLFTLYHASGQTVEGTVKFQMEAGNQATSFEPYVGGTASPNPDYPQEVQTVTGEQTVTVSDGQGNEQTYPVNLGKNLFNKDNANVMNAWAGTDYIYSGDALRTLYISCEPNTTYTVQKENTGTNNRFMVFTTGVKPVVGAPVLNYVGTSGAADDNSSYTITTPANAKYLCVFFANVNVTTPSVNDILATIQIEKGSTATTYAPYVTAFGKNLFNINQYANAVTRGSTLVSLTKISDNTLRTTNLYASTNNYCAIPIPDASRLLGNTITMSCNVSLTNVTATKAAIFWKTTTNTVGTQIGDTLSITTDGDKTLTFDVPDSFPSGTDGIFCTIYGSDSAQPANSYVDWKNIQIEEGSSATTYEPNISGQLELCKIGTYLDYIYPSGSDWYIHKETWNYVFDGSTDEQWNRSGQSTATNFVAGLVNLKDFAIIGGNNNDGYCNYFDFATALADNKVILSGYQDGGYRFLLYRFPSGSIVTDLTSFKTWLGNNHLKMVLVLATAADYKITYEPLIAQLEALAGAHTAENITWFRTDSVYLPAILSVSLTASIGGGVVWDPNGAEWEAGGGGEVVIVNVDSIENIFPVWTIQGKAENPTLTNLTTGMSITYNGTVAEGQTLVIDLLNKTAKLNGTSVISDVAGQWVEFQPGNNRVSYSAENADAPNSTIEWQEVVG